MKVLIVDKNANEIKRITNIIKRNMKHVEITGYASDRRNTLINIEECNPEVIIISKNLNMNQGFLLLRKFEKVILICLSSYILWKSA